MMGHLSGLKAFLDAGYSRSVFEQIMHAQAPWVFHLHGQRVVRACVAENGVYELTADIDGQGRSTLRKIEIKLVYPVETAGAVARLIKVDPKIAASGLPPIESTMGRHFVKNKSLFPLMQEKQVVFFTLLEGEVIRGVITDFSQYDITVNLKGSVPVVILRHSIYDLRDKNGRCYLKTFQDQHKDWQKSPLFVT
jgi:sRNA-binding regulator protein Hfq